MILMGRFNSLTHLTCLGLVTFLAPAPAADFLSITYPPSKVPGELSIESSFHLWLPPRAKHIRAIIIHQHGCGEGAESFGDVAIHDLHLRALAAAPDSAYLCPHYR